jgi:hypothetical protein
MELANKYATGEEAVRCQTRASQDKAESSGHKGNRNNSDSRRNNNNNRNQKRKGGSGDGVSGADLVVATERGNQRRDDDQKQNRPWTQRKTQRLSYEEIMDKPCSFHSTKDRQAGHSTRECSFLRRIRTENLPANEADENGPAAGGGDQQYPKRDGVLMIFRGLDSRTSRKLRDREVKATTPAVPQWLNWSEMAVSFDRSDHPDYIPHPGKHALVVDPQVGGYKLTKVLMDGGSSINIMYVDTLRQMKIPESRLRPSSTTFHGIVPGKCAQPLGQIALEVVFGEPNNF